MISHVNWLFALAEHPCTVLLCSKLLLFWPRNTFLCFLLSLVHLISEKARTRSLASNVLSEHIHHL